MRKRSDPTGIHPNAAREPLMPEVLESLLIGAAASRPRAGGRRRRLVRGLGLGLMVAALGGTAVAATGGLRLFGLGPSSSYSLASASADQTAALAVLRRPQDLRDRGPLIQAILQRYTRTAQGRVLLRSVRYLRPVETTMMSGHDGRWDRITSRAILVLLPNEERGIDLRGRPGLAMAGSICMWSVNDAWPEGGPAPSPPFGPSGPRPARLVDRITGGGTCTTPHQVRMKGLMMGAFNYGAIVGMVPDGVAVVRGRTRDGQIVTSRVVNNSFELLAPGRADGPDRAANGPRRDDLPPLSGQFRHQSLEWLDGAGRVVRRLPQ